MDRENIYCEDCHLEVSERPDGNFACGCELCDDDEIPVCWYIFHQTADDLAEYIRARRAALEPESGRAQFQFDGDEEGFREYLGGGE